MRTRRETASSSCPQDRIVYMSEVFFNEEFPNMAGGYGVSWIRVLDAVRALDADIFIPGHGPIPDDPKQTRAALDRMRQLLVDARDRIQNEIARGATEDQVVATVTLQQYREDAAVRRDQGSCRTANLQRTEGHPPVKRHKTPCDSRQQNAWTEVDASNPAPFRIRASACSRRRCPQLSPNNVSKSLVLAIT